MGADVAGAHGAFRRGHSGRLKDLSMVRLPDPAATAHLRTFTVAVLVLNVLAAVVAVTLNLPAQFGGVGTDAGEEVLTSGTAISAPLLPVAMMLAVVLLVTRRDRWSWVGIVFAYLTALTVGVGGAGEIAAEPTADTPRAVLIGSGIAWLVVAALLVALATRAAVVRPRTGRAAGPRPPRAPRT